MKRKTEPTHKITRAVLAGKITDETELEKYDFDLDPVLDDAIREALDKGLDSKGLDNRIAFIRRHAGVLQPAYERQLAVRDKNKDFDPDSVDESFPIVGLRLPEYVTTALLQQGISTVRDLRNTSGQALSKNPNIGSDGIGLIRSSLQGTAFSAAIFSDDAKNKPSMKGKGVAAAVIAAGIMTYKRKKRKSAFKDEDVTDETSVKDLFGDGELTEKLLERNIHTLHHLLHATTHEAGLSFHEARTVKEILEDFGLSMKSPFPAPSPMQTDT